MNMTREHLEKKNTYKNFTHIIVGSPFEKELLKKCYNTPKSEIIDQVCIPYSWRLNQEEFKKKHYDKYCKHYPMLKRQKDFGNIINRRVG